jgi:EAL domain-containing protein (putative c-di-GMP-specific phosphodiesterase class I)
MSLTPNNVFECNPFDPGFDPLDTAGAQSTTALSNLIRRQDLSVVFQPIVRLATGKVFAYEALTRCSVPAFRNPEVLFERAVRDGCCGRLGRTVREVAIPLCEGVPIFVNVHPRELEEKWLVRPDDPVFMHDSTVYIEITEAVPLTHFQLCKHVLSEVRQRADARLVIDDLGAGFSNVRLIADLEPSVVKLDRSLIMNLDKEPRKQMLVRGLVNMCVNLGAQVVAEGIETAEELEALRDTGAHYGQGYYFARPAFPLPLAHLIET